jgi:hypothetical protein
VILRASAAATTAALTAVLLLPFVIVAHSCVTAVVVDSGEVNHISSCGDVVCESSPFVTVEVKSSRLVVSGVSARVRVVGVGVFTGEELQLLVRERFSILEVKHPELHRALVLRS